MNKMNDMLDKVNRRDGMTVPEGYFADFKKSMADSLPELPRVETVRRSTWQRVRPYAYMAAMFGGIWCMLKMFTMLTATTATPLDNNPVIAEALSNEDFVNEYVIGDVNQWDYYDELMQDGIDPDSLALLDEAFAPDSTGSDNVE